MNNIKPSTGIPSAPLDNEQQVVEFLEQHPEFFARHQSLLQHLRIPHQCGGAISLVERQTEMLREQNREMRSQLHDLLDSARYNDLQFEKTKRLVLNLLEAETLDQLTDAIDEGLCQDFNGDMTRLVLFDQSLENAGGNLKLVPLVDAKLQIAELIDSDWALCGTLTERQRLFLFDDRADKVLSAAVVPLVRGNCLGLLAIGSFEANYFHSSMGTLFLNYVGEVLSRVLTRLIITPPAQE
ncbi:MAG: hypothetical protein ACI9W6_001202 [Motiliproteus sp.]|jgi:uncharacterized protein YigA (DUF484 family)